MTAAFVWWGVVVAGLVGYPLLAGVVYRKCGGRGGFRQNAHQREDGRFGILACEPGMFSFDFTMCPHCRAHRWGVWKALLWPLVVVAWIPVTCFNAGADITATPHPNSLPEQSDTTKVASR